jgi:hypothetical protein
MDPNSASTKLIQLGALLQSALATLVTSGGQEKDALPPKALFDAQRTILAAVGVLTELVSTPSMRLIEVATQYFEARALHIAAEKRIPDMLAGFDENGVAVSDLAEKVGCDSRKLCQYQLYVTRWKTPAVSTDLSVILARIMRCLCSMHIFKEVQPDRFANNVVSAALVNNEPLRAYIVMLYVCMGIQEKKGD